MMCRIKISSLFSPTIIIISVLSLFISRTLGYGRRSQSPAISNVSCPANVNFTQYDDFNICYFVTEPMAFPPQCPYEDVLPFAKYEDIIDTLELGPIWVPVRRDKSNGVGLMLWTEKSSIFGTVYSENDTIVNEHFLENDCLIYNYSKSTQAVPCNDKYRGICAYYLFGKEEPNKLCGNILVNDFNRCRQSDFNSNSSCVCVDYKDGELSFGDYETMFKAEFIYSYQNQIYSDLTSDGCLIGLERRMHNQFIWPNSGQKLTYDDWWDHEVHFDDPGHFIVATKSGWKIEQTLDGINCILYEIPIADQIASAQLDLRLSPGATNSNEDEFILTVSGAESLKWNDTNTLNIVCFTNSFSILYRYPFVERIDNHQTAPDQEILYSFKPYIKKGPGYYWCNAFAYPDLRKISTQLLFYTNSQFLLEFIGLFKFKYVPGTNPLTSNTLFNVLEYIIENGLKSQLPEYAVRLMKVLTVDETTHELFVNFHFTLNPSEKVSNIDIRDEVKRLKEIIENNESLSQAQVTLLKMLSPDYCLPEITRNGVTLTWDMTINGSSSYPKEFCFTKKGSRLKRLCSKGNFIDGASWSRIKESCTISEHSHITENLTNAINSNHSTSMIIDTIRDLCGKHTYWMKPIDIYLISELFEKIQDDGDVDLKHLAEILSDLQCVEGIVLSDSQREMNATNRILDFVDSIIKNSNQIEENHHFEAKTSGTMIILSRLKKSNMTGLVLNFDNSLTILNETYDSIQNASSTMKMMNSAIIFNSKLLKQVKGENDRLNMIIYRTPAFFNHERNLKTIGSKIYGVQFPKIENFDGPIWFLFNSTRTSEGDCVFWKFGNEMEGFWSKDNDDSIISNLSMCAFYHTTHFGLLISDEMIDDDAFHLLDLITHINCGLSLVGLCFILLTGILFKRWRMNTGNQILVNFGLAISLQIGSFYISNIIFANTTTTDTLFCTIIGIVLHYAVVSQFCWMFVIAVLQFKRFVDVLSGPPKYVLVKACFCGWILPIVPVFCVWFLDHDNYVSGKVGLCYPSGFGLYLGVWLPIALIIFINFVIFVYIIYSVVHRKSECVDTINTEVLFQVRLAILLFFMLGLTWTFGFLSEWDFGRVFTYIFCFTATLQGFIMFAFFIVFNKNTRSMYAHAIKCLCTRNKYY